MQAPSIDLTLVKGKTFEYQFLYADEQLVYRPISAMPSVAPVRLTVAAHGLPEQWPVRIAGVTQPTELNQADAVFATVVDPNTVEFNGLDASLWAVLQVSGHLVYNQPVDLTGWSARAAVRDRVGGTELVTWHSDPLVAADGLILVDALTSSFTLVLAAAVTAAMTWKKGVWEMEAIDPAGKVYSIVGLSRATVIDEVVL